MSIGTDSSYTPSESGRATGRGLLGARALVFIAGVLIGFSGTLITSTVVYSEEPEAQPAAWVDRANVMGITVTFTESPCGQERWGGCFSTDTPNVIFIAPGLDPVQTADIILHELAHVEQYRQGLGFDECEADRIATTWGALTLANHCAQVLWEEGFGVTSGEETDH